MGINYKTVGGSQGGKELSSDFIDSLSKILNGPNATGQLAGAGAMTSGTGALSALSDILSSGGGKVGGGLAQLLSKSQERNVNNLRARFGAQGGSAFGTPAAVAESAYRAEAAPQIATQVGSLQLQALSPFINALMGIYGHEVPGAQTVGQKSFGANLASAVGGLVPLAANLAMPGLGGAGGAGGISMDKIAPQMSPGNFFIDPNSIDINRFLQPVG